MCQDWSLTGACCAANTLQRLLAVSKSTIILAALPAHDTAILAEALLRIALITAMYLCPAETMGIVGKWERY